MDVTFNQLKHHPLPPFRRTAGFSATTTISRKDFGITAWPGVIGDTVTLRIEAEALHDGGVTADSAGQLPPAGAAPAPPPDEPASPDQNPTPTPSDLPSPP